MHPKNKRPTGFNRMIKPSSLATALIISAASFTGFNNAATAGAWVPSAGTGYNKLGYAYYKANDFLGGNLGEATDDSAAFNEFIGKNTSFYFEQGLGNQLAVFGSLLYQQLEQTDSDNNSVSASGLSDVELGLRYQWQLNPFVVSTSFLAKLPYLYDEHDTLPLGNGQEDYELKVLFGKGLNQYGYLGLEIGYRYRTSAPSDQYRYLFEYGFNVNKNIYLRAKLDGILSANNADIDLNNADLDNGNLAISSEFDSGKIELTAGWNFDKQTAEGWGTELTFSREIYGDNILQGNSLQLGITKVY